MNYWLLSIPILSALTGWIFFRLLVWAIFRPRNRTRLAVGAGKLAAEEFRAISLKLQQQIADPAAVQKILPMIETHVDEFLRVKLPAQMPMIGMFIGEKTISTMKGIFLKEIEEMFPMVISQYAGDMLGSFDAGKLVTERIAVISLTDFENKFRRHFTKQVKALTLAGIVIGLIIGLIQLAVVLLSN